MPGVVPGRANAFGARSVTVVLPDADVRCGSSSKSPPLGVGRPPRRPMLMAATEAASIGVALAEPGHASCYADPTNQRKRRSGRAKVASEAACQLEAGWHSNKSCKL